jgi:hypothetical protein
MMDPSSRSPDWLRSQQQARVPQSPGRVAAAAPRYRMSAWRVACGICWGMWTLLFGVGAIAALAGGQVGTFLGGAVLGGLSAWYDYRIWTCKARRLTLFIIF